MPAVEDSVRFCVMAAFFSLLAASGAVGCWFAVSDYAHARDSRSWERVEGVILSSRPEALRYAYVAGGRTHESRRAKFATAIFNGAAAPSVAPGQRIAVLVNPDDPSLSVLKPGGSTLVFGAVTLSAAALVFLGVAGLVRTATRAP